MEVLISRKDISSWLFFLFVFFLYNLNICNLVIGAVFCYGYVVILEWVFGSLLVVTQAYQDVDPLNISWFSLGFGGLLCIDVQIKFQT